MQQRKLQTIADIASIEAARKLGCTANLADVLAAAQAAAERNGFAGELSQSPNLVELGNVTTNTASGIREFNSGAGAEAVYVRATQDVPKSLVAGGIFGGNITLSAEAVSIGDPSLGAFSAGSFTVRLESEESAILNGLIGGALGGTLNLDAVAYRGIADANVSLLELLQAYDNTGGLNSLLNTDIRIGDLLALIASAATQNETADAQAIAAMQTLISIAVNNVTLKLSDVIAVTSPDVDSAAKVRLNALSLILTSVIIANGNHAVTIPLAINIPSITGVNALVTIIEPPQMALGPAGDDDNICTIMRTAQVRVQAGVLINIPLLARIDLALVTEVAQGSAGLRSISQNDDESVVQIEASPGIASIQLWNNARTGPARISTLLNIPIADIGLDLPIQPADPQILNYTVQHPVASHLPQMQTVASPLGASLQNALNQPGSLDVTLLSFLNLGLVNTVVSTVVSPLLGELGRVLLDPLLGLLGIKLGGMDVTLEGIQYRQAKPLVI